MNKEEKGYNIRDREKKIKMKVLQTETTNRKRENK
jgi:hypothetical protein